MSRYTVYVTHEAWQEMQRLPGHMRQRVRRAIDSMSTDPRSAQSQALTTDDPLREARRLRLDRWRIVYTISEQEHIDDVLAVRKRPPYDYGDLNELLRELG
jgi:mRNA interferase RelE/StbE